MAPPGATHWVIATQTCNVQNDNLVSVPAVELIAAREIGDAAFDAGLGLGERPRQLHTRAHGDGSLAMALHIHERAWIPRGALAEVASSRWAIEDLPGDRSGRYKEIFSNWLARSYVRVELPDDFNQALAVAGVKDKVFSRIKRKGPLIQGIYLSFRHAVEVGDDDEESTEGASMTPSEVAKSAPPWHVGITVVVMENCPEDDRREVLGLLQAIHDQSRLPITKLPAHLRSNGRTKCSMAEIASSLGVVIEKTVEVVGVKSWTVHDLAGSLRFTDYDYLSSADENADI